MTTKKQPEPEADSKATITKHKATRRVVQPSPQAFDIIPRSQVRPSTTSRPVIPSGKPDVADNTMTQPSKVQLGHQIRISPNVDSTSSVAIPATPDEPESGSPAKTKVAGVSVRELLAKRTSGPDIEVSEDKPVDAAGSAAAKSEAKADTKAKAEPDLFDTATSAVAAEAAVKASLSDAVDDSVNTDGSTSPSAGKAGDKPVIEITDTDSDNVAADDAEKSDADKAGDKKADDDKSEVSDDSKDLKDSKDSKELTEVSGSASKSDGPKADKDAEDPLADVLKDDTAAPQEQSETLKTAIKDMDEGAESDKDGPQHHELYGGKPVIVVHKPHGAMSAAMWLLWFFVCVALAVLIVNFLLDAGIIDTTYNVPHTDLL